jgi:predicted DNA-binding protein (MmcQ/YjbR family)
MARKSTALRTVARIALALPEATQKLTWESSETFRVRDKIFAMHVIGYDGRVALWCKAPPGAQEILVGSDPARFFRPPYVGHNGWVGVYLDGAPDWSLIADLMTDSYRMTAPKRLSAQLDANAPSTRAPSPGRTRRRRSPL